MLEGEKTILLLAITGHCVNKMKPGDVGVINLVQRATAIGK